MEAYILEWLNLLLRWAHLIVGIAWIGSSFYFVWLDTNLNRPPRDPEDEDVAGDLWAVHGGGFYHSQKYQLAPKDLPTPLHWFKWEAYTTFLTGFALLIVVYYFNANVYLIDKSVADISATQAVGFSLFILVLGWFVYDLLCKSKLDDQGIALFGFVLLIAVTYGVFQLFGGRGAFTQIGTMLGTTMVANVFFVIIPGQKEMVAAKLRGEEPQAIHGIRGKQRSVHNNYITLPVLFVMLSNHYPMLYGHTYNWVLLIVIFIVGVLIRHFFNLRNQGKFVPALPAVAILILVLMAYAIAPDSLKVKSTDISANISTSRAVENVSFPKVQSVIKERCVICHSAKPNHPTAPVAPNGVMFDTAGQIKLWGRRIHERTVVTKTMPLANLTLMSEDERALIDKWFTSGASIE
ncbi:MAG: putative membrane protein [Gammaproteobacteria bacterium]|jgi:uncharacterized membrane protein